MPNISDNRQKEKFLVGLTLEEKELLNLYAKDKFASMSEIMTHYYSILVVAKMAKRVQLINYMRNGVNINE